MQTHRKGELDSLSDTRSSGMAEADREEVEDITGGSVADAGVMKGGWA